MAERKASIVEPSSDQDEPPGTADADGPQLASSSDDRVI